ncbi:MAG: TatD family hydrolase [Clostridia bacterium]|nr:TatD family hydrolase [Clostridia bacterium]
MDSHAHLDDAAYSEGVRAVLERAHAAGVGTVINPGYNLQSSQMAVSNAGAHPEVYALVGIHPHDASGVGDAEIATVAELLSLPKVVGIGEIGLDYYRDLSPRDQQLRVFRSQLELAREMGVPVEIHNRDAHHDTLEMLREYAPNLPAVVMHCYSGSSEMASDLMRLGCYISFAGPVTYRNSRRLIEAAAAVPLERMLVETDSPYLPPSPYRGERNEPAYVVEVVRRISELKNVPVTEVEAATAANAAAIFRLSPA